MKIFHNKSFQSSVAYLSSISFMYLQYLKVKAVVLQQNVPSGLLITTVKANKHTPTCIYSYNFQYT